MQHHPIQFVGAGPGNEELLTLKALRAIEAAEVILHDRLVGRGVLDFAGPGAELIAVGKEGFGPSVPQDVICGLLVRHGLAGRRVVRLKGGDCAVFGRLDEELDAITAAGLSFEIVPGITAASAAVASIGQSLTKRGRNASVRLLTGHDMQGFADHDWKTLARPGEVAAIYMGKRAARFVQGRLLMFGASPDTPVTAVANASRPNQTVLSTVLADLPEVLSVALPAGPALILYGLAPRAAMRALPDATAHLHKGVL